MVFAIYVTIKQIVRSFLPRSVIEVEMLPLLLILLPSYHALHQLAHLKLAETYYLPEPRRYKYIGGLFKGSNPCSESRS